MLGESGAGTTVTSVARDSWRVFFGYAVLATGTLAGAVWIAGHARHISPAVHTAGLVIHLTSLAVGFGGVLIADSLALRWAVGRASLSATLRGMSRLHTPIWLGLAGLVASGCVLEPNLSSMMTQTKLAMVLVLTLNGIQASALSRRLRERGDARLTTGLLAWSVATGLVSQVCWWTATAIGVVNAQG
ncbi:hypothetical protein OHB26_20420 [Nocardia sp. NBC_01503]|uniref:hypothetical protein n=1 Tax=Nocardia sp. NBC_01503 TaxID=2975997 RepID=UPI002E7B2E06|nr:hypothetical protein [Nocardia sp. NBC_01503]WTL29372.1 hypothetical protein OHB26_20420 [Nocardia sp. NBC_01503]